VQPERLRVSTYAKYVKCSELKKTYSTSYSFLFLSRFKCLTESKALKSILKEPSEITELRIKRVFRKYNYHLIETWKLFLFSLEDLWSNENFIPTDRRWRDDPIQR
jgi:hypothetical protein